MSTIKWYCNIEQLSSSQFLSNKDHCKNISGISCRIKSRYAIKDSDKTI